VTSCWHADCLQDTQILASAHAITVTAASAAADGREPVKTDAATTHRSGARRARGPPPHGQRRCMSQPPPARALKRSRSCRRQGGCTRRARAPRPHGQRRCMSQPPPARALKRSRSCRREGRPCQNSIACGRTRKPPQLAGRGMSACSSAYSCARGARVGAHAAGAAGAGATAW